MAASTASATALRFVPMSPQQRHSFLAQPHVAVVAIPRPGGRGPLCAPVWYAVDPGPGGELWWITPRASRKGRLLHVGLRLTFTVMSGPFSTRYASVEGTLVGLEAPTTEDHQVPLAVRYLGDELGTAYGARAAEGNDASWLVRVRLERWLSGEVPGLDEALAGVETVCRELR